jgi:MazG family protein
MQSLRPYLLEETYELLEAMEGEDPCAHCEELGDVLLQIVFQSELSSEAGQFDVYDVVDKISRKLIRRHPHVFGEEKACSAQEVINIWENIKTNEKNCSQQSILDTVPKFLPALLGAQRLSEQAGRVGFDWTSIDSVMDKIHEEIKEVECVLRKQNSKQANTEQVGREIGDLMFAIVNLARHLKHDAESLLRSANKRFRVRFRILELLARERGLDVKHTEMDILEQLWQEAKKVSKLTESAA